EMDQQRQAWLGPMAPQLKPLDSIPGVNEITARDILAEMGLDTWWSLSDTCSAKGATTQRSGVPKRRLGFRGNIKRAFPSPPAPPRAGVGPAAPPWRTPCQGGPEAPRASGWPALQATDRPPARTTRPGVWGRRGGTAGAALRV